MAVSLGQVKHITIWGGKNNGLHRLPASTISFTFTLAKSAGFSVNGSF